VITVQVVGIRLEVPSNQPVLILRDEQNSRYLPLWIGPAEASAISIALDNVKSPRPLTHDLMKSVIENFGDKVISVSINELIDGTFYATINFANHEAVSARPSDAVALALRCGVAVMVASEVLDEAALPVDEDQELFDGDEEPTEAQLEAFRAFLDDINPEDFS
jgi:bifunctional DNase/RNase